MYWSGLPVIGMLLCAVLLDTVQVKEASKVYGVTTLEHPAVQMISMERGKYYLGGKLQVSEHVCEDVQVHACVHAYVRVLPGQQAAGKRAYACLCMCYGGCACMCTLECARLSASRDSKLQVHERMLVCPFAHARI